MPRIVIKFVLFALAGLIWMGCEKASEQPDQWVSEVFGQIPTPEKNPLSEAKVVLGKRLFFDPQLSQNGRLACSGCHFPAQAFSDGIALSAVGASGKRLLRHSPALFNIAWAEGFFWDGGAKDLESQAFGPLQHPDEMAMDLRLLPARLSRLAGYPSLFEQAFGDAQISSRRIAHALAAYQRTLISDQSLYDRWQKGQYQPKQQELAGHMLYLQHCQSCHPAPFFTDFAYHNNGLDSVFADTTEGMFLGRGRITRQKEDIGKYKTPSLRNLSFTAPYMHDGRLPDLPAVLDHYQYGIRSSATLDTALLSRPMAHWQPEDRQQLLAFLRMLNDSAFTNTDATK